MSTYVPIALMGVLFVVTGVMLFRARASFAKHTRDSFESTFGTVGRFAANSSTPAVMGGVAIGAICIGIFALGIAVLYLVWPLLF